MTSQVDPSQTVSELKWPILALFSHRMLDETRAYVPRAKMTILMHMQLTMCVD